MADVLPDVLGHGLVVVFCGTAASRTSARAGAYYANPGNTFWRALHNAGITPRQFAPSEFQHLLELRIGLTDLAKSAFGSDRELRASDFDAAAFTLKIEQYQPQIAAFTSKRAFLNWNGSTAGEPTQYGWQEATIGATQLFVLPSPSGAARRYWDISPWETLSTDYWARMNNDRRCGNPRLPH